MASDLAQVEILEPTPFHSVLPVNIVLGDGAASVVSGLPPPSKANASTVAKASAANGVPGATQGMRPLSKATQLLDQRLAGKDYVMDRLKLNVKPVASTESATLKSGVSRKGLGSTRRPVEVVTETSSVGNGYGEPTEMSGADVPVLPWTQKLQTLAIDNIGYIVWVAIAQMFLVFFLLSQEAPPPSVFDAENNSMRLKSISAENLGGVWHDSAAVLGEGPSRIGSLGKMSAALDVGGHDILNVRNFGARELQGRVVTPVQPYVTQLGIQSAPLNVNGHDIVHAGYVVATEGIRGEYVQTVAPQIQGLGAMTADLDVNNYDVLDVGEIKASSEEGDLPVLHASVLTRAAQQSVHRLGPLTAPWDLNGYKLLRPIEYRPSVDATVSFSGNYGFSVLLLALSWDYVAGDLENVTLSQEHWVLGPGIAWTRQFKFTTAGYYGFRLHDLRVTDTTVWGWIRKGNGGSGLMSIQSWDTVSAVRTWNIPSGGSISDFVILYLNAGDSVSTWFDNGSNYCTMVNGHAPQLYITRFH